MIEALGYVGIAADAVADWAEYGEGWMGLQLVERTAGTLRFRMDDRKQRFLVSDRRSLPEGSITAQFFGWEVADGHALDALGARLEKSGLAVKPLTRLLCDHRRIAAGITFRDPAGNVLEAFHGGEVTADPFVPGRHISGFRTGALGMGHAVLRCRNVEPMIAFYRDVLGFKLSDFALTPFVAYFFHVNPRHHSLALIGADKDAIHHLMVEFCQLDDVGQSYDIALSRPGSIATSLGRHTNDHMTSFYANTPSDFFMEFGWGGRTLETEGWQPYEMHHGTSLWGHERTWLPPSGVAEAKALREKVVRDNMREPVNVMPGNYTLSHGACPWWEGVKAESPKR